MGYRSGSRAQGRQPGTGGPGDPDETGSEASALDQALDQSLSRESRRVRRGRWGWDALDLVSGLLDLLPPW
jgi:hypothetical protein